MDCCNLVYIFLLTSCGVYLLANSVIAVGKERERQRYNEWWWKNFREGYINDTPVCPKESETNRGAPLE